VSQLDETAKNLEGVLRSFQKFRAAVEKRHTLFSRFRSPETAQLDSLQDFTNSLIQHLSQNIVIKEHRDRYQVEQFDRMMAASLHRGLRNKHLNLDAWCDTYASLIEDLIDNSHSNKCPYILANYDHQEEHTVNPINSTFFYYYFSSDKWKRLFGKWILSASQFPNLKMRQAYMRFFS